MQTTIPFSGFYESMWSNALDDAETSLAQYLTGDPDSDCGDGVEGFKGRSVSDVGEALYYVTAYSAAFKAIAKEYAERFAHEVDYDHVSGPMRLKFVELHSPKEYNFTTDRIYMELPRASVRRMRKECSELRLQAIARERFTSYDGFISFYSPDPATWGSVDTWDANQVGALLVAWIASFEKDICELDIYDDMSCNGVFDSALDNTYDLAALLVRLQNPED